MVINDVKYSTFLLLLQYIYCDQVDITIDTAMDLFQVQEERFLYVLCKKGYFPYWLEFLAGLGLRRRVRLYPSAAPSDVGCFGSLYPLGTLYCRLLTDSGWTG